ncbi:hypothetical protein ACQ4LE_010245 [Meloidogyne hapla]|uniref:Uncharacterized protein n=1 Tax=Meloidogyne hapla TaxID=6305 RepID=A0A1I8B489_MELHA
MAKLCRSTSCRCNSTTVNVKPASTLLYHALLLAGVALLLLGEVRCSFVGLGQHYRQGEFVETLNATIAIEGADLAILKSMEGACDVDYEEGHKYIRVSYKKDSNAAKKGCVLDLATKLKGTIEFDLGVSNGGNKLSDCLIPFDEKQNTNAANDNLLPFGFSMERGEKGGPVYGSAGDCDQPDPCANGNGICMKTTNFAAGWAKQGDLVVNTMQPIGEPRIWYCKSVYKHEGKGSFFTLRFSRSKVGFEMERVNCGRKWGNLQGSTYDYYNPYCYQKDKISKFYEWEIRDKNYSETTNKYLLTFHLLPQSDGIQHGEQNTLVKGRPSLDALKGPKCRELFARFLLADFRLLIPKTAGGPPPQPSGPTPPPSNDTAPPVAVTTSTEPATSPAPTSGSSVVIFIIIGVVVVILIVVAAVLVWLFVFNKKDDEQQPEDYFGTNAGGTATKTKTMAGTTVGATQAKTAGGTTVGGTTIGGGTKAKTAMGGATTTKGGATATKGGATTTKGGATTKKK